MNLSFLKGSDGKISMMRVSIVTVIFPVMVMFVIHNIVSLFGGNGFVSMGMEEVALISAALGTKAVQSFAEPNNPQNYSESGLPTGKTE